MGTTHAHIHTILAFETDGKAQRFQKGIVISQKLKETCIFTTGAIYREKVVQAQAPRTNFMCG